MQHFVYVLDMDGKPLMPTRRFGKVRRMLRSGAACVITSAPFTIRLLYRPATNSVQNVTLGIDPGRTNIGLSAVRDNGTCLYQAECVTRNREIPKLMQERRQHRQASRRGERLARKRLAKKLGTTRKGLLRRKLPGCGEPVTVKDIINTEARFANRKRPEGWLTPTARQLLQTHLNLISLVERILPVSRCVLELNKFAFMEMEYGRKLPQWAYQQGPMYGYETQKDALADLQEGRCLLCGENAIEHNHHLVPRSKGGSDRLANRAGLCTRWHGLVHKDAEAAERLAQKKAGLNKKYHALSVLNQIILYLADALAERYPEHFHVTTGRDTKRFRETHSLEKTHGTDVYCIACSVLREEVQAHPPEESFTIRPFRRHNRARIQSQKERAYVLDGQKVAVNRRKRTEQKTDSLAEWYAKAVEAYGAEEADSRRSRMKAQKSVRRYHNPERLMPGTVFLYEGRRYVMSGQLTGGKYLRAFGIPDKNFPAAKCSIVSHNRGLVYVT